MALKPSPSLRFNLRYLPVTSSTPLSSSALLKTIGSWQAIAQALLQADRSAHGYLPTLPPETLPRLLEVVEHSQRSR